MYEDGNVHVDLPHFGMVLKPWGGDDCDYGDGDDGITAYQLVDVTFPHLYNFMNGSDGYSSFRGIFVNIVTATETRRGMKTVTVSFTSKV